MTPPLVTYLGTPREYMGDLSDDQDPDIGLPAEASRRMTRSPVPQSPPFRGSFGPIDPDELPLLPKPVVRSGPARRSALDQKLCDICHQSFEEQYRRPDTGLPLSTTICSPCGDFLRRYPLGQRVAEASMHRPQEQWWSTRPECEICDKKVIKINDRIRRWYVLEENQWKTSTGRLIWYPKGTRYVHVKCLHKPIAT